MKPFFPFNLSKSAKILCQLGLMLTMLVLANHGLLAINIDDGSTCQYSLDKSETINHAAANMFMFAPPPNDDCGGAIALTVNPDLNCGAVTSGTLVDATASPEDPAACGGTEDDDVWFTFVATATTHEIELLNIANGTIDLYHSVWEGTCGSLTLVPGTCSDPNSSSPSGLTIGTTYHLRVYSWTSTPGQTSTFDVCIGTPPPPPANDDCANATPITVENTGDCPANAVSGSTEFATDDGPFSCDGTNNNMGVWYSFVAPAGGEVNLQVVEVSGNHEAAIFDACGGTEVFCDGTPNNEFVTGLTGGNTYFLIIWSDAGSEGTHEVCLQVPPPPPANDDCANAISINVENGGDCPANAVTGSTVQSTDDGSFSCDAAGINNGVWYSFVAPASGAVNLLINEVSGNHEAAIFDACGGNEVFCDTAPNDETVTGLTGGNTYFLIIWSDAGSEGTHEVCLQNFCPEPNTLMVDNITGTSADLTWTPGGGCSIGGEYWVEVGGSPAPTVGSGTAIGCNPTFPINVTGLTSGTTYDVWVYEDCGAANGTAGPVNLGSFLAQGALAPPICENFDGFATCGTSCSTVCTLEGGFTNSAADDSDWLTDTGGTGSSGTGPEDDVTGGGNYLYLEGTNCFNQTAIMTTPTYDISGLGTPALDFHYHMFGDDMGTLTVDVEDPAGSGTFTQIFTISGQQQAAQADPFIQAIIPLTVTGPNIAFRFTGVTGGGFETDMAIDEICVNEAPACADPLGLTANATSATTATLAWDAVVGANSYDWEVVPQGNAQGVGVVQSGNTASITVDVTGLMANTAYSFYVRADCGGGALSNYSGPTNFTTPCATFTAPYTEDFENGGAIPACWVQGASNAEDWIFATTGGHVGNAGNIGGSTNSGGFFAYVDDSSPHSLGTTLESPFIDVSGLSSPELSFFLISDNEGETNVDFSVDVWDGAAWNVGVFTSNSNTLNGEWEQIFVDLTTLTITGPIQLRFIVDENNGSDFDDDVAIDDVTIGEPATCPNPSALAASNITPSSADISWTPGGGCTASGEYWVVAAGSPAPNIGSGAPVTCPATFPINVTGLMSLTAYDVWVYEDCGANGTAGPVNIGSFGTPCGGSTCDYTFSLEDDFGDGWNGAQMEVQQNGVTVATLTGPAASGPEDVLVPLCDGVDFDLVWTACGSFESEVIVNVTDPSGTNIFSFGPGETCSAGATIFTGTASCPSCAIPSNLVAANVTGTSADLSWTPGGGCTASGEYWVVAAGSPAPNIGSGAPVTCPATFPINVTGLMSLTAYDVWVYEDCGANGTAGPVNIGSFGTPCGGSTCDYTFSLEDDFGDGWNGAQMEVQQNGVTVATLTGPAASGPEDVLVPLCDGVDFDLVWTACGSFESEVIVNVTDPSGTNIFSFGPGETCSAGATIFTGTASCPSCAIPSNLVAANVTSTSADLSWTPGGGCTASGEYWVVAAGSPAPNIGSGAPVTCPATFPINVTGLMSLTAYDVWVYEDCGANGTAGPVNIGSFGTPCGGSTCDYTFSLEDDFGDGWNGAEMEVQQNGVTVATLTGPAASGPEDVLVPLCDGVDFDLVWTACGSFESEVIVNVTDPSGTNIFSFGPGETCSAGATIFTGTASCPSCLAPSSLAASNLTTTSADLSWTPGGGCVAPGEFWVLTAGSPAPTAGTGAIVACPPPFPISESGLMANTTYEVYVSEECGPNGNTGPVNIGSFTTPGGGTVNCGTPLNQTHCYDNNDMQTFLYTSTSGTSPLTLTFNAGGIESCCDNVIIYNGADNTAPELFNGNNGGDLTGISVTSTAPFLFMEIDSDVSVSCQQDGSTCCATQWDWDVECQVACDLIINEVDYDQPGTDNAEFIEIYNPCGSAVDLSNYTVELVNGSGGGATVYDVINLPSVMLAAGDYFVICADASNTPNCDLDVSPNTSLIQNGAPDAVGLRNGANLVDAVSYEGSVPGYTETDGTGLEDPGGTGDDNISIARIPNATDTDVNNVDFRPECATPGATNDVCPTIPTTFAIAADDADKAEGNAGLTPFTFTVTRSGDDTGANDVDYAVTGSGGDPADSDDFGGNFPSGTVMFAAGETTMTVTINVSGDIDIEPSEGFTVTLSNPTNGATITTATADGNIQNDDGLSCPAVGDLVITEIMQNPFAVNDSDGEFFEVWNSTGSPINMDGFTIKDDGSDSHVISGSLIVPANGFVVLGINADFASNGGVNVDYEYSGFNLANGDDEVIIECQGVTLDAVRYDGGPTFPDPTGATMSLDPGSFNPTANDDGTNWCEGTIIFGNGDLGTPGAANPACPVLIPELAIAADDADKNEGDAGNTIFAFTVTRSVNTTGATSVDWAVTGSGSDPANAADFGGTFPNGTVNFAAGETTMNIAVNVSGDTDVEPDEGFTVTLSNPTMGAIITTSSDDGVIRNDDCTLQTCYADIDDDGYGAANLPPVTDCNCPAGYKTSAQLNSNIDNDCDDTNMAINPNATEVCDGIDNNCDSNIDEGVLNTYYADTDMDGFGDPNSTTQACSAPTGFVDNADDCDDTNMAINPNATEVCDGVDNNCDSNIDEGVLNTYYADTDMDGFGDPNNSTMACSAPTAFVDNADDCDDTNMAINPNATEVCDGVDNDCDGTTDENPVTGPTWYADTDMDGFGDPNSTTIACSQPTGFVANSDDCDDTNAAVNPNATEVCNGIDDDCDGMTDEAPATPTTYYQDADMDGFGDPAVTQVSCAPPTGFVANADDCDDTNAAINPNATEVCDGIDNNCDSNIDEGVQNTYYADNDMDGFGDPNNTTMACSAPTGFVDNADDCDDTNAAINPNADEVCDGVDNDCDGTTDENPVTGPTWYADTDMDGFGDAANSQIACSQPTGFVANALDCDDTNAAINPNAAEVCDGVDNDCDGDIDEFAVDAPTWYADTDMDGFGDQNNILVQCDQPTGYVSNLDDCNDNDAAINPNTVWYVDFDGDGFGNPNSSVTTCNPGTGYVLNNGDCNDNVAAINPNATEVCNGIDDNCDGQIDEGVQNTYYEDADMDGFGNPAVSQMACSAPSGYVANADDCDDTNAAVNPNATEVCNGIDDDCDGNIDEGVQNTYYADTDMDGFGDPNNTTMACSLPSGFVTNAGDCDDTNATINPNATEICGNAIDDNCDGQVDEGCDCTIVSISTSNISDCDDNGTSDPFDDTFTADVTVVFSSAPATGTLDLSGDGMASVSASSITGVSHTFTGVVMSADAGAISLTAAFSDDPNCTLTNGNAGIAPQDCSGTCVVQIVNVETTAVTCPGYGNGTITINAIGSGQVFYSIDGGGSFQPTNTFTNLTPGTYNIVVQVLGTPPCEATTTVTVDDAPPGAIQTWYQDQDDDGYSPGNTIQSCTQPNGFELASNLTSINGDCNDYDPTVNVVQTWYADLDGDGYGSETAPAVTQCLRPFGHFLASELTETNTDCDDSVASTYPGAPEICNGVDDDCDGMVDEGATGGLTFTGNVFLPNQAAVNAFSQCYSIIDGNLYIQNSGVTSLANLINLVEVTGDVRIRSTGLTSMAGLDNLTTIGGYLQIGLNHSLTTLDGLESVATVGGYLRIYRNSILTDCCAIYELINGGGVSGSITISNNATGCDNVGQVNTACAGSGSLVAPPNGSVDLNELEQQLSVYPNPMRDVLNVSFAKEFEAGTLKVLDLRGRLVKSMVIGAGSTQFQLSLGELNAGMYMLHVVVDGENFTERLIVND